MDSTGQSRSRAAVTTLENSAAAFPQSNQVVEQVLRADWGNSDKLVEEKRQAGHNHDPEKVTVTIQTANLCEAVATSQSLHSFSHRNLINTRKQIRVLLLAHRAENWREGKWHAQNQTLSERGWGSKLTPEHKFLITEVQI